MDSGIPVLRSMSLSGIYRWVQQDVFCRPFFARPSIWSPDEKLAYLNQLFRSMCSAPMILMKGPNRTWKYEVIDGWQRISTLASAGSIWFDLESREFEGTTSSGRKITLRHLAESGPEANAARNARPGLDDKTVSVYRESLRYFYDRWEAPNLPVYFVESDSNTLGVFASVNIGGRPLTLTDLGRPGRQCLCDAKAWNSKQHSDKCTTSNAYVQRCEIRSTDHARFFGLPDIHCAVHTVEPTIVNALCSSTTRLTPVLAGLALRAVACGERLGQSNRATDAVRKLEEAWAEYQSRDCADSDAISGLDRAIEAVRAWANECLEEDGGFRRRVPRILVRFDGCFLSSARTVCGEEFLPGVYVSSSPRTDKAELLYHELTHAYLHYHKLQHIDCPWIEEGLAELCEKLWASMPNDAGPSLDFSVYSQFTPSEILYYDFLEVIVAMTPNQIEELFRDYTFTAKPPKPSLEWCTTLIQPYCV